MPFLIWSPCHQFWYIQFAPMRWHSCVSSTKAATTVAQELECRIVTGRARNAAAGMRASPAQVQAGDGSAVLRPARHRAHEEQLLQSQVAVKNISFREAVNPLQIERGQDLPRDDGTGHVGSVFSDFFYHPVTQQFAVLLPCALPQEIGHILHKAGHDV